MEMTVREIQRSYNAAKNKKQQIGILADLNDCDRKTIEDILQVSSVPAEPCHVAEAIPEELTRGEIMDKLFARLDALDKEIKVMEEEYRNISITISVLGKIGGHKG